MLVCLQEYRLVLQDAEGRLDESRISQLKLGSKVEVLMQIDDIQVISFDRFNFKMSQLVDYDENIRIHLNFVTHFIQKKALLEESKIAEDHSDKALVTTQRFIESQIQLITRNLQASLQQVKAPKPAPEPQRNTQTTFEYFEDKPKSPEESVVELKNGLVTPDKVYKR